MLDDDHVVPSDELVEEKDDELEGEVAGIDLSDEIDPYAEQDKNDDEYQNLEMSAIMDPYGEYETI